MNTKRLLSSTVLYGAGDALVLLVGGFLLLPLYTRALSQAEFGQFVVIRTGIELLTYLLHFGLLSALARLYFDHPAGGARRDYVGSVVLLFLALLAGWATLLATVGTWAWGALAPSAPAWPYLWLGAGIAVAAFFGTLASTWLRLEGRAEAFVALQLGAAAALAVAAFIALVPLSLGLHGLLLAMLAGPLISAAALPWLFGRSFSPRLDWPRARATLHYALPALASLVAYFVLNRVSVVILQRHAPLEQVAVFGLAQQLALLISLTGVAFGKAMQPAVFGAATEAASELMRRFGRLLTLALTAVTSLLMLFAAELLAIVAPASYRSAHDLLLVLAVATFAYALGLLADTALLLGRRPRVSATLSLCGAALSTALGLLLIPRLAGPGAALAAAIAFVAMMLGGQLLTARLTGHSFLRSSLGALALVGLVAVLARWLHNTAAFPPAVGVAARLLLAVLLLGGLVRAYVKGESVRLQAS